MRYAIAIVAAGLAACGGGSNAMTGDDDDDDAPAQPSVELVALPPLFGHQSVTHVRASDPAGVVRVELYLDDARVGAAEFAPFDVSWDASGFTEGSHHLRAV